MASLSIHGMEASSESPNENDSAKESSLLNPKLSIQEKVTRALQNVSISKQTKAPVKDVDAKSVQTETITTMTELMSEGSHTKTPVKEVDAKSVQIETNTTVTELMSEGSQTKTPVKEVDEKSVQIETNTTATELISEGIRIKDPAPLVRADLGDPSPVEILRPGPGRPSPKKCSTTDSPKLVSSPPSTSLDSFSSFSRVRADLWDPSSRVGSPLVAPRSGPGRQSKNKCFTTDSSKLVSSPCNTSVDSCAAFSKIECLRMRLGSVMELMKQKRLFAVQEFEGRRRYAQISLQEKNRILLHCLKDQVIPSNAHLFKHSDVLQLVNVPSRLVFLELWSTEKKKTLGKLFIRLSPDGKRAQQFALLCSGQKGPSYVDSNIVQLFSDGKNNEFLQCGDYEKFGGNVGSALVPDVLKENGVFRRPCMAGTIWGYMSYISEEKAGQFFIYTRDNPVLELNRCFGMVEEGLPILRDAIDDHEDIRRVNFCDAGLVLDI